MEYYSENELLEDYKIILLIDCGISKKKNVFCYCFFFFQVIK